jgi:hypothetical protein
VAEGVPGLTAQCARAVSSCGSKCWQKKRQRDAYQTLAGLRRDTGEMDHLKPCIWYRADHIMILRKDRSQSIRICSNAKNIRVVGRGRARRGRSRGGIQPWRFSGSSRGSTKPRPLSPHLTSRRPTPADCGLPRPPLGGLQKAGGRYDCERQSLLQRDKQQMYLNRRSMPARFNVVPKVYRLD